MLTFGLVGVPVPPVSVTVSPLVAPPATVSWPVENAVVPSNIFVPVTVSKAGLMITLPAT